MRRPSLTLFRDLATPTFDADYERQQASLVAFHLTTTLAGQSGTMLLGLRFPHGVLDAPGVGLVVAALDAELAGREWTLPALPTEGAEKE